MATETEVEDMILKRPRIRNDPYSQITDEQLENIRKRSTPRTHFHKQVGEKVPNKRFYKDLYATTTNQHLFRGEPGCYPVPWIDERWQSEPPQQHNTSRYGASVPWGPEKQGERTYSHFDGEDVYRYVNIDCYRRAPTNVIGRTVHKFGRAGEGYYQQRNPNCETWFGSCHILNRTDILEDIHPKPLAEHQRKNAYVVLDALRRKSKWPEISEYTDRYEARSTILPKLTGEGLARAKRHVEEGRRLAHCYEERQLVMP